MLYMQKIQGLILDIFNSVDIWLNKRVPFVCSFIANATLSLVPAFHWVIFERESLSFAMTRPCQIEPCTAGRLSAERQSCARTKKTQSRHQMHIKHPASTSKFAKFYRILSEL